MEFTFLLLNCYFFTYYYLIIIDLLLLLLLLIEYCFRRVTLPCVSAKSF